MDKATPWAFGVTAALAPLAAVSPESSAAVVYTQSDLQAPVPETMFVTLTVDTDTHRPPRVLFAWGTRTLPAGPHNLNIDIPSPPDFDAYALIGRTASGGVLVSFGDPAFALGRPFSDVFPGFQESQVADAIAFGGPVLDQFVLALDTTPGVATEMQVACRTIHFSDGVDFGSFVAGFEPVPAPGCVLFVSVAGTFALTRRRRHEPAC